MQRYLVSATATYQVWIEVAAVTRIVEAVDLVAFRGSPTIHFSAERRPVVSRKGRTVLNISSLVARPDSDNLDTYGIAFRIDS